MYKYPNIIKMQKQDTKTDNIQAKTKSEKSYQKQKQNLNQLTLYTIHKQTYIYFKFLASFTLIIAVKTKAQQAYANDKLFPLCRHRSGVSTL